MKDFTLPNIALFLLILFVATNNIKAQTPMYSWSFESSGANIGTSDDDVRDYCTPGPYFSWGCEGKFGRGCMMCFRNITLDFPGGLPNFFGVGVRRGTDSSFYRMFLAAGTPVYPGNYLNWSHIVPLYQGQNYLFKCYVKNLNRSQTQGQPIVRLQIEYLNGPQKGTVQNITEYQSIASNDHEYQWDSIQGAWHNTSNCNAKLEVATFAPDVFSEISDTFGYMLGIDSITLSLVCGLNTPTTWCVGQPLTMAANISADPALDSIRWYVNNVFKQRNKRDSLSYTLTPRSFTYTFPTANPATKIKIIRYFTGGIVDSCSSYINVLPAVSASFSVAQSYARQLEMTNTSVSATSYTWDMVYTGGSTYLYTTNPTFTIPGSGTTATVNLTASGSCGTSTTTQSVTLCTWSSPHLSIDTLSTHNLSVTYKALGFTDSTHLRFYWSFGDGTYTAANDSSTRASHTYAVRGNYRVTLVATKLGCSLDTTTFFMNLCPSAPHFTPTNPDSICYGDSIYFSSPYSYAKSYAWYVNGELMSTAQSTYIKSFFDTVNSVKLVVNTGCTTDTFTNTVYVSPSAMSDFKFSTMYPALSLKPSFTRGSSYSWVIYNSIGTPVASSPLKNYSTSSLGMGTFTVTLTVGYKGCTKSTSKSVCVQQDIRNCCQGCATSN